MDTLRIIDPMDRSIERELKHEGRCIQLNGFGHSLQGRTFHRHFFSKLVDAIYRDLAKPIDKGVWRRHLKQMDIGEIADRLLVAGLTVGHERQKFGIVASWIGKCLGQSDKQVALRVGTWGVNMLLELPIFSLEGSDQILTLHWSNDLHQLVAETLARRIGRNHLLLPMLTPPIPWSQTDKGIVPPDEWSHVLLVDRGPVIDAELRDAIAAGRMDGVLKAVNFLQSVPLAINTTNLDLLLDPNCPARPPLPAGPEPPTCEWNKRSAYIESVTRVGQWETDMTTARLMAAAGRFWEPKYLDFRGRVYDFSHFNYLREDPLRSTVLIADGERIGHDGLLWLKAAVAGEGDGVTWGAHKKPSKLNFAERIDWVDSNREPLRAIAEAALRGEMPRPDLLPPDDDHPWGFIAACVELYRAGDNPDFVTHLPISFDGCCSGMQHLCAVMRDEVGGRYVNLVPGSNEDFYEAVAMKVHESPLVLGDFYERITGLYEICAILMDGERDRKLVKAPVMTWNYGATLYRMAQQVAEVLRKRGLPTKGAWALARAIDSAIKELAPRAVEARVFLEQLVDICTAHGMALQWPTLLGMPIINHYYEPEYKNFNFPLAGGRRRVKWVIGDTDEVKATKARNSVTANFVHSLDATHLHMIALGAKAEGINMLCIHDSFACLPSRAGRFNEIIREQFVRLHSHDPLLHVLEETRRRLPPDVALPSPPLKGTLNVSQVLHSYEAFA